MTILGIEQIIYGVTDLAACRQFFADWGLKEVAHDDTQARFETLNGCTVLVVEANDPSLPPAFEDGPTLREVTWGVATKAELDALRGRFAGQPGHVETDDAVGCIDPNGMAIRVEVTRKRALEIHGSPSNVWGQTLRVDRPSPIYERAEPVEVGHVVFFTNRLAEQEKFYQELLGFEMSDRYPGRGAFMRCAPHGGHHDIFLLALPGGKRGLNHVAFTVRDIHEVFGGGMHISRCGWDTQLGPGRHPVSSAYFWYFQNPAGGLIEYYADEDQLTPDWQPRDFEPGPTVFAEWAIDGGIDGNTRRQKNAKAPEGKFMTERKMTDAAARQAQVAQAAQAAYVGLETPRTIVVIGGGQAAGWVVKTLRKEGFDGRLVMIADEIHLPYERPPLSKAVLAGEADIDTVRLVKPDDFAALNVEAWQPDCATSIDRKQQIVRTQSGREVRYDRLVIATGGAARRLPDALVQTAHIAYLRTLDEAVALGERLRASRRVLVVGGGWIGLEVAATARKLGVDATVVEGAPRLCARSLPPMVSDFLLELHRANGVEVRLNASLVRLEDHPDDASRLRATFADGSTLDADFAVAGIGLTPHTALAEAAGIEVADGIVVDHVGATGDPRIFACGDVANHPSAWLKRRVRLESWANAQNQAIAAAKALLGIVEPYADIPWFWSDQYDVNLQILGDIPVDATLVVRGDLAARRATLFHLEDGAAGSSIRGVVAINTPRELKLSRKWMNQGRTIDLATLTDASTALA